MRDLRQYNPEKGSVRETEKGGQMTGVGKDEREMME